MIHWTMASMDADKPGEGGGKGRGSSFDWRETKARLRTAAEVEELIWDPSIRELGAILVHWLPFSLKPIRLTPRSRW